MYTWGLVIGLVAALAVVSVAGAPLPVIGMELSEVKVLVSQVLGLAIVAGSVILKLPQVINIVRAGSVAGISGLSFYLDVAVFAITTTYNVLEGNPFSTYGEAAIILAQNLVLVVMYWHYAAPPVAWSERIAVSVFGAALVLGMIVLPADLR